jgi:hypothetical protein
MNADNAVERGRPLDMIAMAIVLTTQTATALVMNLSQQL